MLREHSRFLRPHHHVKATSYGRRKTCRTPRHLCYPATWALRVPTTFATQVATAPSTAVPRTGARFCQDLCKAPGFRHGDRRRLPAEQAQPCVPTVCALSSTSSVPTSCTLPRVSLRARRIVRAQGERRQSCAGGRLHRPYGNEHLVIRIEVVKLVLTQLL
jgi:hypothetical protein